MRGRTGFFFVAVVVLAAGLRVFAAFRSGGLIHADEHQQYLEVAQGMVYGPHAKFWEYERGTRNLLYPTILAGGLWSLDHLDVHDPIRQAACLRALLALAVLAGAAFVARRLALDGEAPAGALFLLLAGLTPTFIDSNVHTLSETASVVPLLLALCWLRRRPVLAGVCLGLAFGIRIQSVFLICGFLAGTAGESFRDRTQQRFVDWGITRLTLGLAAGVLFVGFVDRITWGHWFHSVVQNVAFSVVEGGAAAQFGSAPWHTYLRWYVPLFLTLSPLLLPLIAIGAWRDPTVAAAALLSFVGHAAVPHKEFRFLFPIVPLLFYLAALGFGAVYVYARSRGVATRRAMVGALALTLLAGGARKLYKTPWIREPDWSNFVALRDVGRAADLTGVAVFGIADVSCGNYFYLRRDVPLVTQAVVDLTAFRADARWTTGKINYLVSFPENAGAFADLHPVPVETVGPWEVYKLGALAVSEAPK